MARVNNNYDKLHPEAKKLAQKFGMDQLCFNPYFNNVAQLIEVVHSVHESLELIDELLADDNYDVYQPVVKPTTHGEGAAAVEVPRGILFHNYEYDKDGICIKGNCIIPTNQNHANIQKDFEKLVPELIEAGKAEDEIRLALEMLVRSYDPCISCSTHYLQVEFN
jgi:sulfhydrogenase subunit alpha